MCYKMGELSNNSSIIFTDESTRGKSTDYTVPIEEWEEETARKF